MDMFGGAWSGGSKIGAGAAGNGGLELEEEVGKGEVAWVSEWDGMVDRKRGWVIAACWGLAVGVEYVPLPPSAPLSRIKSDCLFRPCSVLFLYHFVRRPTHILDHAATLTFNHVVLTTYFSGSFPKSIFFWVVLAGSTAGTVVWAEQLCVKREMKESMGDWSGSAAEEGQAGEESIPLTARSSD